MQGLMGNYFSYNHFRQKLQTKPRLTCNSIGALNALKGKGARLKASYSGPSFFTINHCRVKRLKHTIDRP